MYLIVINGLQQGGNNVRIGFGRLLLAIIFITIGVILILENIGLATFKLKDSWLYIYPIIFILYGIKLMIDRMRFNGGSWLLGSFLVIFGTLLLLDRFNVIVFKFNDIGKLWPLLIVYIGVMFFSRSHGPSVVIKSNKRDKYKKFYKNPNFSNFSIGNHEYNQPNWKVEPLYLTNLAGDFYFDFTKAFIPEKETPITISALAGDVHILMPENVDFSAEASVKAGDIDIVGQSVDGINRSMSFKTANYEEAVRRINFTLKLKAGSVRIDQIGGNSDEQKV